MNDPARFEDACADPDDPNSTTSLYGGLVVRWVPTGIKGVITDIFFWDWNSPRVNGIRIEVRWDDGKTQTYSDSDFKNGELEVVHL